MVFKDDPFEDDYLPFMIKHWKSKGGSSGQDGGKTVREIHRALSPYPSPPPLGSGNAKKNSNQGRGAREVGEDLDIVPD